MITIEKTYKDFFETDMNYLTKQMGFVYDGPMDYNNWENSKLRILFYYKETYGYDEEEEMFIIGKFKEWIKNNKPTYKKMGLFSYLLIETVKNGQIREYNKSNLRELYQNDDLLIESLENASIINIGKISIPENKSSDTILRRTSKANKDILKSQLEILQPKIIICGGRVAADSLYCDIDFLSKNTYEFNTAELVDDKIIAPFYHLSSTTCSYKQIHDYYLQIIKLIQL